MTIALRIVKRVLLPAFLAAVVVYLLTGLLPKSYTSTQTLYFPLNPAGGIGALGPIAGAPSGGDASAVPGLGGAITYPLIGSGSQTASGIINSHACRLDVARRLRLPEQWNVDALNAAKRLSGLIVAETDKSGLLSIRVTCESPALSVAINHEVYGYLKRRTDELTSNTSGKNRRLVQDRLRIAREALRNAEVRVVSTLRSAPLAAVADIQKDYLAAQKVVSDAKASRDGQRARLKMLEGEFQRLASLDKDTDSLNALTTLNPAFAELAQEVQRRRLQLYDSMIVFSSGSARVYQARKAYENAERISAQVKKGLKSPVGLTSPEIIRARAEMAALDEFVRASERTLADTDKAASASPEQYAQSAIAKDDFEAALARVSFLRGELEKAAVLESRDPTRFEIIDQPFEDPTPVAPRRTLFAVVGFFVVAALCFIPFLITLTRAIETSADDADERSA